MKKRFPAILTAVLLLAALLVLAQRERWRNGPAHQAAPSGPEDVIWQMSDAAREGKADAYLACFSGELRARLEKTASEMGATKFTAYLQQLNREINGIQQRKNYLHLIHNVVSALSRHEVRAQGK